MKFTDCKDTLSPSVFFPHTLGEAVKDVDNSTNPYLPRKPTFSPSLSHMYVCDSKWNPCHPNRFVSLADEDVVEVDDHYPCLPDLNEYLLFEDNPHYNIVTVESVPNSLRIDSSFTDLPSGTPSLEASPAGTAAWGRRARRARTKACSGSRSNQFIPPLSCP
ncbi:hypothetical protein DSO57_1034325 [Entomophthora muscae]|uniref:Uncharacterized protein n=1 Tax=Entomophthora muscae TaxID=34485 RepID=A0ACC2REJ7_9FUNG|nr:hypothetical protein DSO57_1034325 [Entomophthora muscae]